MLTLQRDSIVLVGGLQLSCDSCYLIASKALVCRVLVEPKRDHSFSTYTTFSQKLKTNIP